MGSHVERSDLAGAGALLGAAAGSCAGRAGYGGIIQQTAIVAHSVVVDGTVDAEAIARRLASLITSPRFRNEPETSRVAPAGPVDVPLCAWTIPLAMRFRRTPDEFVAAVEALGGHADRASLTVALAFGGAVAACTHGQTGRDLWWAVEQTVCRSARADHELLAGVHEAAPVDALASLAPIRAVEVAARVDVDPDGVVRDAAAVSRLSGLLTGALLGARHGVRRWRWEVEDEAWFSEVGHRLMLGVAGRGSVPSLPSVV